MSSSSLKDIEGSTSDSTLGDGAAANEQVPWIDSAIFNEQDRLVAEAKTYHKSTTVLKLNHPLMIMVKEGRTVSVLTKRGQSFARFLCSSSP